MELISKSTWSGILATSAMTMYMLQHQKELESSKSSPLPPAILTSDLNKKMGLDQKLSKTSRENLSLISHFGYGIGCALLYSFLRKDSKNQSTPVNLVKGGLFGASVWGFSYILMNPALGTRPTAQRMPIERNKMMILAHLVFGATLAYAEQEFSKSGNYLLDGDKKAPRAE